MNWRRRGFSWATRGGNFNKPRLMKFESRSMKQPSFAAQDPEKSKMCKMCCHFDFIVSRKKRGKLDSRTSIKTCTVTYIGT